MKIIQSLSITLYVTSIILTTGCLSPQPKDDLFQQLGGLPGIERFVDIFISEIGESKEIRPYFEDTNLDRFREKQIEHICLLSGGPCTYTGDSIVDSHRGMGVNEADFNTLVDITIRAMNKTGYSIATRNRMLALIAPLRSEVIEIE